MTIFISGLVLASVSCLAIAQRLLKTGMFHSQEAVVSRNAGSDSIAFAIATNIWIIGATVLYFFGRQSGYSYWPARKIVLGVALIAKR